jgi:hypothetical protein
VRAGRARGPKRREPDERAGGIVRMAARLAAREGGRQGGMGRLGRRMGGGDPLFGRALHRALAGLRATTAFSCRVIREPTALGALSCGSAPLHGCVPHASSGKHFFCMMIEG